ncbi:hypothetical protein M9H77_05891 [Catharanthus roseus]|uniref:Uncharacterized protein n=1 Tax=Catharanthus roseus TaxID=4058 RepID=A0ACC0BQK1_CATRO|nr:hypothetical protein M9H77_05891 [Catharanthus roseus]
MKTIFMFLSLILFSTLINNSFAFALESVLDEAGKKLRADSFYFILPDTIYAPGQGGGLIRGLIGNDTCSLGVVQDPDQNKEGLPLRFYPFNAKKGVVRVSTDLNIQFGFTESCNQYTVWKLEDNYFVGLGGVVGNLSPEFISSWFKIEKYRYGYKLVYCPSVCSYCQVQCKDIGIVYENGKRRLALSDAPYQIKFRKAA